MVSNRVKMILLGVVAMITTIFVNPASAAPAFMDTVTGNATAAIQYEALTAYGHPAADDDYLRSLPESDRRAATNPLCATSSEGASDWAQASNAQYLPVERWGKVSTQHYRLKSGVMDAPGTIADRIQRAGTVQLFLSLGNMAWNMGSGVTEGSSRFCLGDRIYTSVDSLAGGLGDAVMKSGIVIMLFIASLLGIMFKARNNGGGAQGLIRIMVSAGILVILINGAMQTREGDTPGYGKGSPGWFAYKINTVVHKAASMPASAINDYMLERPVGGPEARDGVNKATCSNYTKALNDIYKKAYENQGVAYEASSVVPRSLNAMWEATGLRAYVNAQFGVNNSFGERAYCHLLDRYAGVPSSGKANRMQGDYKVIITGQKEVLDKMGVRMNHQSRALKWRTNKQEDEAMIAWAACVYKGGSKWEVDPAWGDLPDKAPSTEDCMNFFTKADDDAGGHFDFGDDPEDIAKATEGHSDISNFIGNLHGTENTAAIGVAAAYLISSIIVGTTFALLGLAVFVAKLGLVALTMFAIFVAITGLIPGSQNEDRIMKLFKQYVGMAFLAFGATLIISFVAILSRFLQEAGAAFAGTSSVTTVIWTGLAPIASIYMIHRIFTQYLKAPSPFKLTSGQAFGAAMAGGAIGGAAGGGAASMFQRQMQRARMQAEHHGRAMASRAVGKTLRGTPRVGGMSPMSGGKGGAAMVGAGTGGAAMASAGGGLDGGGGSSASGKITGDGSSHDGHLVIPAHGALDGMKDTLARGGGDITASAGQTGLGLPGGPTGPVAKERKSAAGQVGDDVVKGMMGGKPLTSAGGYASGRKDQRTANKLGKMYSLGKPNGWDKKWSEGPKAAFKERAGAHANRSGRKVKERASAAGEYMRANAGKHALKAGALGVGGVALGAAVAPAAVGAAAAYAGVKAAKRVRDVPSTHRVKRTMKQQDNMRLLQAQRDAARRQEEKIRREQERELKKAQNQAKREAEKQARKEKEALQKAQRDAPEMPIFARSQHTDTVFKEPKQEGPLFNPKRETPEHGLPRRGETE